MNCMYFEKIKGLIVMFCKLVIMEKNVEDVIKLYLEVKEELGLIYLSY